MDNVLSWAVFGLIAGAIAKFVLPGKDPGGCLVTMLIGIVGAFLGGFFSREVLGGAPVTGFDLRSFAIAVLGSIALLLVYRMFAGRRR